MHSNLYHYKVTQVISVYDGDTARLVLDCGFKTYAEKAIRLSRLDTPEMRDPDPETRVKAYAARDYLRTRLDAAMSTGSEIIIRSVKLEKYGRSLAELYIEDTNVNDEMLALGLGAPYQG